MNIHFDSIIVYRVFTGILGQIQTGRETNISSGKWRHSCFSRMMYTIILYNSCLPVTALSLIECSLGWSTSKVLVCVAVANRHDRCPSKTAQATRTCVARKININCLKIFHDIFSISTSKTII